MQWSMTLLKRPAKCWSTGKEGKAMRVVNANHDSGILPFGSSGYLFDATVAVIPNQWWS
jgi:hypothetical protein